MGVPGCQGEEGSRPNKCEKCQLSTATGLCCPRASRPPHRGAGGGGIVLRPRPCLDLCSLALEREVSTTQVAESSKDPTQGSAWYPAPRWHWAEVSPSPPWLQDPLPQGGEGVSPWHDLTGLGWNLPVTILSLSEWVSDAIHAGTSSPGTPVTQQRWGLLVRQWPLGEEGGRGALAEEGGGRLAAHTLHEVP